MVWFYTKDHFKRRLIKSVRITDLKKSCVFLIEWETQTAQRKGTTNLTTKRSIYTDSGYDFWSLVVSVRKTLT